MTSNRTRTAALLAAVLLVTAVVLPAVAAADSSLSVAADQTGPGEEVVVTVTQNGTAVENASVSVTASENYTVEARTTDVNGTVLLPAPDETTTVTLEASVGNLTAEETVTLEAAQSALGVSVSQATDGSVTIDVADDGPVEDGTVTVESPTYVYTGSYAIENGTVSLPAPTENVSVNVTATVGNDSASTTAELIDSADSVPENDFAEDLGRFIQFLQGQSVDGDLGQQISAFVHEHNPAANDDERGPPEHAGNSHDQNDSQGPPADAPGLSDENESADDRRGPPEHAEANGQEKGDQAEDREERQDRDPDSHEEAGEDQESEESTFEDDDDESTESEDEESSAENEAADDRRGPPAHANNPQ